MTVSSLRTAFEMSSRYLRIRISGPLGVSYCACWYKNLPNTPRSFNYLSGVPPTFTGISPRYCRAVSYSPPREFNMVSTNDYTHITVDLQDNGVLLVTYNKPESGNALSLKLVKDLLALMQWSETQPTVRIIVFTGKGKFYSTGMELIEPGEMLNAFSLGGDFHQLNRCLILSDKILVAAVNGPAAGFGVSSLALCDLVYSVPDAYFFTPFVKWGMTTEASSSYTLPKLMGHQKAALLCLSGDQITADEAHQLGLISKILPGEDFLGQVMKIVHRMAKSPPGSLRTTKKLMRDPVREELLSANDREIEAFHDERIPSGEPEKAIKQFVADQKKKRKLKSKM